MVKTFRASLKVAVRVRAVVVVALPAAVQVAVAPAVVETVDHGAVPKEARASVLVAAIGEIVEISAKAKDHKLLKLLARRSRTLR